MNARLDELAELALASDALSERIPGLAMAHGRIPAAQLSAIYPPMIGFIVQGRKTMMIGSRIITLDAPSYFVVPTALPASGSVQQGERGRPYLSLGLALNHRSLAELLNDLPPDIGEPPAVRDYAACTATPAFIDAWLQMLRLVQTPTHRQAMFSAYERVILYHVLRGAQGWRLRDLARAHGEMPAVHGAVQWIREHYADSIDVPRIAQRTGLAVTTFHRHFKQLTGLSPIQFQKQLRLLEARTILKLRGSSVAETASTVGYESSSQFNREYARLFGLPPGRDAADLHGAGKHSP